MFEWNFGRYKGQMVVWPLYLPKYCSKHMNILSCKDSQNIADGPFIFFISNMSPLVGVKTKCCFFGPVPVTQTPIC